MAPMGKRHKAPEKPDELTRDTPVKVDLPFDEALRRLVQPRQATKDEDSESEGDSR